MIVYPGVSEPAWVKGCCRAAIVLIRLNASMIIKQKNKDQLGLGPYPTHNNPALIYLRTLPPVSCIHSTLRTDTKHK